MEHVNTVKTVKSKYPHIEWIDLLNNGVLVECAIVKKTSTGDVHFFPVDHLDIVDQRRLLGIVSNRNATAFPLWDLMRQVTLNNGCNALEYFHQLTKVRTPSGQIFEPSLGRRGAYVLSPRSAKGGDHGDIEAEGVKAPRRGK